MSAIATGLLKLNIFYFLKLREFDEGNYLNPFVHSSLLGLGKEKQILDWGTSPPNPPTGDGVPPPHPLHKKIK